MEMIENFAALSAEEQREFAEALVATINSESTFTNETNFKVLSVEADDTTGDLIIDIDHEDLIDIRREASWTCIDEDEVYSDPGYDADYTESIYTEAKAAFKTLSTEIEGYQVELDIADVDVEETVEVDVDDYSHEDAGIGSYEFWGHTGYDSRPYIEVNGTITKACSLALALFVSVAENTTEQSTEDQSAE